MLLYYNKYGQLLENLEYGPTAKVGSTTFKIIAYFDLGAELDFSNLFSNATIDFLKPDLNDNGYPPMLMKLNDNFVFDSSIENSNYFHNGQKYSVYEFDFGSFTDGQDIVRLLDTPGMWFFTITLIGASGNFNVQGRGSFNVGHSASESDDLTELSIYTILESVYSALGTKLNIANGIVVLNDETHPSGFFDGFTVGQVFYQKNVDGGYLLVKTVSGTEKLVDLNIGFIELENAQADANLSLCERKLCILKFENSDKFYYKVSNSYQYDGSSNYYAFAEIDNLEVIQSTDYSVLSRSLYLIDKTTGEITFTTETYGSYYKKGYIDDNLGVIELASDGDNVELNKCAAEYCIIKYENEIYFKGKDDEFSYYFFKNDNINIETNDYSTLYKDWIEVNKVTGVASYYNQDIVDFYTKEQGDEKFAKLNYDNTFRGANIFNDVVPEIGSGAEYTPSNLNQLASTGKLKEVSDDLATEVSARESADALLIPLTQKGVANGVATLDNNAKIPLNQLPDSILGQVKWVGNIYIVSSTSADSYNMRECGVVQLTDYALNTLGLTGQTEITINGLTVTGTNLVTYLDLFNAIIEKYDDARLVSMFFIVSSRINHNGPVWTGYNVLTDVALSGFTSPSVQEYFTHISTGDWIMILSISNLGSITYAKVDNSDAVVSVNGQTGPVTLYGTDIKLSSENNTKVTEKFGSIETDIAPYWNSANTYVVGDLVIYNGKLYKCIVNIPTPENNFVPFHWQSTSVKTLLKTLPQYVDITILTTDWNNNSVSKTTGVTDLGEYDIVLCLPNGYENDAYVRAFGVELSSFVNETGVATFNCMETPTETIHITLQILRR